MVNFSNKNITVTSNVKTTSSNQKTCVKYEK
jgi:hypothetical protein